MLYLFSIDNYRPWNEKDVQENNWQRITNKTVNDIPEIYTCQACSQLQNITYELAHKRNNAL